MTIPAVALDLTLPPVVVSQGRGVHGVRRRTDEFRLPELWSLHLYNYDAELEVDGATYPIRPGSVSLVPPGARIRYRYRGRSEHLYAHLQAGSSTTDTGLRLVMSPGASLPAVTDLMRSAVASAATRPARTRADVWSVLLRLAELEPDGPLDAHAEHVSAAMSFIESHLADPISVADIADAVGVTPDHLTRLFRRSIGRPAITYLRHRRIETARRLLTGTTMSIGAIASLVGIPDLQAFNKTCRSITGSSPRQVRLGEVPSNGHPL